MTNRFGPARQQGEKLNPTSFPKSFLYVLKPSRSTNRRFAALPQKSEVEQRRWEESASEHRRCEEMVARGKGAAKRSTLPLVIRQSDGALKRAIDTRQIQFLLA